jgi:hypothetical protein
MRGKNVDSQLLFGIATHRLVGAHQDNMQSACLLVVCMHVLTRGMRMPSWMPACRFVQECAKRGLLVMLDMHRLAAAKDIPELW